MQCVADPDVTTFARNALGWLLRDPVRHNVMCTLVQSRLEGGAVVDQPAARWLRVLADARSMCAAALQTPPWGLALSVMPPAGARVLAEHLHEAGVPSVDGPEGAADAFAARHAQLTRVRVTPGLHTRMYRLDEVTPPNGVPGRLREAVADDRPLIVHWVNAFTAEAVPHQTPSADVGSRVDSRLTAGGMLWLWEDAGQPVSFLWRSPAAGGVVRISAVYTPPELRGRGYASGCVAAASQLILRGGATACMLYTDVSNPTSNKIYQRIGYHPIGDCHEWRFG